MEAKAIIRSSIKDHMIEKTSKKPESKNNQEMETRGLFCQADDGPVSFIQLDNWNPLPNPTLIFLPEAVYLLSSLNGIVCAQSHNNTYFCNPLISTWRLEDRLRNVVLDHPSSVLVKDRPWKMFYGVHKHQMNRFTISEHTLDGNGGIRTREINVDIPDQNFFLPNCPVIKAGNHLFWILNSTLVRFGPLHTRGQGAAPQVIQSTEPLTDITLGFGTIQSKLCFGKIEYPKFWVKVLIAQQWMERYRIDLKEYINKFDWDLNIRADNQEVRLFQKVLLIDQNKALLQLGMKLYLYNFLATPDEQLRLVAEESPIVTRVVSYISSHRDVY